MIKVERYEKYKKLKGYEYVNEIPANWELLPNIAIFSERINKGHSDEELLSVTIGKGIIRQSDIESKKDSSNEDKSNYKLVKTGDIAYNKMRMWQGAIGTSSFRGIVSPAYIVLKRKTVINPEYFHYQFRTNFFNNYSKRFSYGLCDDQLNLRYKDFKRMYSIVPPFETQNRIVEYLNKKTQQANNLIEKQERLIDLIKEEKKAIINKAVTNAINPDVEMKDSGIEWLGDIPKHWEFRKLKFCIKVESGQVDPKQEMYSSKILIAPNHIESGTGKIISLETAKSQGADSGKYIIKKGELVYSKIRPELRKVCISPIDGLCSADMYCIKQNNLLENKFLLYYFLCDSFTTLAVNVSMRVAMPKVNREALGDFIILIPPKQEQIKIVEYIEKRTSKIDTSIEQAQREITLIKDYIESLIYNAVTGQIKV